MQNLIDIINKRARHIERESVKLMEVCGTHTMAIGRSGLRSMMPEKIDLLSGPGCPVCVTPVEVIDYAIELAKRDDVVIVTFGDMVRVPGTEATLENYDPVVVYSPLDTIKICKRHPDKSVIFIGIGFETTAPTVGATILTAVDLKIKNFFVIPAFKIIPPALEFIAAAPKIDVQGLILPGHVSAIIGSLPYKFLSEKYRLPGCVTGFEPIEILKGILNLVDQIVDGRAEIAIEYRKVVTPQGNIEAQKLLQKVFKITDSNWRGIGSIPESGLTLKHEYRHLDASRHFKLKMPESIEPKGCICGQVLLGLKKPSACGLFGNKCTPLKPVGPCMVSSEGSCAAYYKYSTQ